MATSVMIQAPLRIVVVEDYQILREQLIMHLQAEGHVAVGVDCGEDLDQVLLDGPVDMLLLDLNLPFEDGNSIALRVRKAFPHIGIIMHTVRTTISEKVEGYSSGADIYLSKPASAKEINAAIASLARRLRRETAPAFQLDVKGRRLVTPQGEGINLTLTEVSTLKQLAIAPNMLLEYDRLLDNLQEMQLEWDQENLEVHFSRLRKKLAPVVGNGSSIKAVRGQGYQLCLPVQVKHD